MSTQTKKCHRREFLIAGTSIAATLALPSNLLAQPSPTTFVRIPTQYIAALADDQATTGNNAQHWGLWELDPGPRGVNLDNYERLRESGGVAPAQWVFDNEDWWLEEHGLIMEAPEFPMPAGTYLVTGDRDVQSILTVHAKDSEGNQLWQLSDGASIYDVTHLRCRSGRYTPMAGEDSCTPAKAQQSDFPVRPGAPMPNVEGCNKLDYAVLIILAVAETNG